MIMDYFKQNKAKKLRQQLEAQVSSLILTGSDVYCPFSVRFDSSHHASHFRRATWCSSVWMLQPFQRTSCPTPSRCPWWLTALVQPCESAHMQISAYLQYCTYSMSCLCVGYLFRPSPCRTRGGFVALSPISPQELFLQPMSSDKDAGQQQNVVRKRAAALGAEPYESSLSQFFNIQTLRTVCRSKQFTY